MKKKIIRDLIKDFAFYTILPAILFSLLYFLEGINLFFFLRTFLILILINTGYLIFKISKSKSEEDYKKLYEEESNELIKIKNSSADYKRELEKYFIHWAHQIKTPITGLKYMLENGEDLNDISSKTDIRKQLIYIEDYVQMTLNYMNMSDKESKNLDFTLVKLDDVISKILKKYSMLFISKKVKLSYQKIEDFVLTDAKLIHIVIEQLISNALKYSEGKSITISYDTNERRLDIIDTGIGIDKGDLPRIFEKGFSGINGRLNSESSGLGLYIVKLTLDKLNQKIVVNSNLGEGSRFSVYFNELNRIK